jgi:hypothetical protein
MRRKSRAILFLWTITLGVFLLVGVFSQAAEAPNIPDGSEEVEGSLAP